MAKTLNVLAVEPRVDRVTAYEYKPPEIQKFGHTEIRNFENPAKSPDIVQT